MTAGDLPSHTWPVVHDLHEVPPLEWCVRSATYPREHAIHHVFADVAARHPTSTAVRSEREELTYQELNARATELAGVLIERGVRAADRVGILMDRSVDLIVAQLGILKAGATYVPMDPGAPRQRIAFYVTDAKLALVICTAATEAMLSASATEVLRSDRPAPGSPGSRRDVCWPAVDGGGTAYVMYTSGSTGIPKGVEITHRGVIRLVRAQSYFPAGHGYCSLLLGSPGFDGTTYEIWSALLNGGCCAVFPDRWIDHRRLREIIRELRVTSLWLSTGLFNQIIDRDPQTLASASHVLVGGEALSASHIRRAMAALPHVRFGNGYGPTECTTFACAWIIEAPERWGCESVPLGPPLNNTECYVVDDRMELLPVGIVGELLLGGDGLARGYLDRPELTDERFIRHPFSRDPDARLYRTGDRCYWLPNGMLAYVGRNDDQVKLRGYRIELGEVEAGLRQCPGVKDAAALVWNFRSGVRGLVGCVVVEARYEWDEHRLLAALADRLPENMRLQRVLRMDALPLTQNGKVDRRRLGESIAADLDSKAATSSPVTALESELLSAWCSILNDPDVDVHSDFFHCGGDSLLALELTMLIEHRLGRRVVPGLVHRFGTPRALAQYLSSGFAHTPGPADTPANDPETSRVFFVPGVAGYGVMPRPLIEAIAPHHPYFDRLTFPPQTGELAHPRSVQQLAAELVEQVERCHPAGTCILVGFSFGGLVAFELARQLAARGRTVAHVVLWDAMPASAFRRRSLLASAAVVYRRVRRDGVSTLRPGLVRIATRALSRLVNDDAPAVEAGFELPAFRSYDLARFESARITVMTCEARDFILFARSSARETWSRVIPAENLEVIEMPGDHGDILEQHVTTFAQRTAKVLERHAVRRAAPSTTPG